MYGDGEEFVTVEEGERVAKKIGARMYLECSAKTGEGVKDIFELATRLSLEPSIAKTQDHNGCVVL